MGKLCIYLPPFASDYSGVCSALFDFDCLVAINDASCCTSHYVYYDEPRWEGKPRPTFSTQLRSIDAILGNDDRVRDCVLRAAAEVDTEMIALVGTPVPAITGMDMDGIACEIESRCGRITLGFGTTGFAYYDHGVVMAGKALLDRFAVEKLPVKPGCLNILGMTPLDFGAVGNDTDLCAALADAGHTVNACLFMGSALPDVSRLSLAEVNLAVSSAGVSLARRLLDRFGTPYVPAFPMGLRHFRALSAFLQGEEDVFPPVEEEGGRILILLDQVMGNSLRSALRLAGCRNPISVASFFGWDRELAMPGDFPISSERQLIERLRSGEFSYGICDPLVAAVPEVSCLVHFDLVHPAVSGRMCGSKVPRYLDEQFDHWLDEVTASVRS